ncbi:MAG: NUDIX domain-containing protein, partial [Oscillospiraceae bacterium]
MPDEKEFLKNYNIKKYEQPSVAADIAVFTVKNIPDENYRKLDGKKLCLLMIKRGKPPFQDQFALPGGFAKKDETVDSTALRELFEETSVE